MTNSDWSEGFRTRLEVLQTRYGISKAEMARKCGLPSRTLENYFKGHKPGVDALLLLSRGLGIDLDWLLGEAPEDKKMVTDLIGEAVYMESRAVLSEIASTRQADLLKDGSDIFGQPIGKLSQQLEARAVARYIQLQKEYAAPSLKDAEEMALQLAQSHN
jgi:transcriptional regulator with XRE-family HTH domain